MECNKDEAINARSLGEKYLKELNYSKAYTSFSKSKRLYSTNGIDELILESKELLESNSSNNSNSNSIPTTTSTNNNTTTINEQYQQQQHNYDLIKKVIESKTHYEKLSLSINCTDIEIKKQYKSLAILLHPDKNKSPNSIQAFQEIGIAKDVLCDIEQRKQYDIEINNYINNQHQSNRYTTTTTTNNNNNSSSSNIVVDFECINSKYCQILKIPISIFQSYSNGECSILCRNCEKESAIVKCKSCLNNYHLDDTFKKSRRHIYCHFINCGGLISVNFPNLVYNTKISKIFFRTINNSPLPTKFNFNSPPPHCQQQQYHHNHNHNQYKSSPSPSSQQTRSYYYSTTTSQNNNSSSSSNGSSNQTCRKSPQKEYEHEIEKEMEQQRKKEKEEKVEKIVKRKEFDKKEEQDELQDELQDKIRKKLKVSPLSNDQSSKENDTEKQDKKTKRLDDGNQEEDETLKKKQKIEIPIKVKENHINEQEQQQQQDQKDEKKIKKQKINHYYSTTEKIETDKTKRILKEEEDYPQQETKRQKFSQQPQQQTYACEYKHLDETFSSPFFSISTN